MDAQLAALEEKVLRLASLFEGLRAENESLRLQLFEALKTRDDYGRKLDAARSRLESLAATLPDA